MQKSKKFHIVVNIDPDKIEGNMSVSEWVRQELGWLNNSGIYLENYWEDNEPDSPDAEDG